MGRQQYQLMNQNKQHPIEQVELAQCSICQLQPMPQSIQYIPFILTEIALLFVSLKMVVITLFISYSFAKCCWYCPQCKREVEIETEVQGISDNIILRMGNCMIMLSKFKFRIIAFCIIVYLAYLLAIDIRAMPKSNITKTWESIATNAGYEAFLENAFKANSLYNEYPKLDQWTLNGIFLRQQQKKTLRSKKYFIKMNPSQFKNPQTEDIVVIITSHTLNDGSKLQQGDIVQFSGQWEGRQGQGHLFKFVAMRIKKTGSKASFEQIKLLVKAEKFIRIHEQQKTSKEESKQSSIPEINEIESNTPQ